jgi:hypothetical protein
MNKLSRAQLPEVLSPKHVQSFLQIGKKQTYEMMEDPPFNTVRVGRLHKISKVSFLRWFDGGNSNDPC